MCCFCDAAFNLVIVVGSDGAAVANAAVVGIGPMLLLSFVAVAVIAAVAEVVVVVVVVVAASCR